MERGREKKKKSILVVSSYMGGPLKRWSLLSYISLVYKEKFNNSHCQCSTALQWSCLERGRLEVQSLYPIHSGPKGGVKRTLGSIFKSNLHTMLNDISLEVCKFSRFFLKKIRIYLQ